MRNRCTDRSRLYTHTRLHRERDTFLSGLVDGWCQLVGGVDGGAVLQDEPDTSSTPATAGVEERCGTICWYYLHLWGGNERKDYDTAAGEVAHHYYYLTLFFRDNTKTRKHIRNQHTQTNNWHIRKMGCRKKKNGRLKRFYSTFFHVQWYCPRPVNRLVCCHLLTAWVYLLLVFFTNYVKNELSKTIKWNSICHLHILPN